MSAQAGRSGKRPKGAVQHLVEGTLQPSRHGDRAAVEEALRNDLAADAAGTRKVHEPPDDLDAPGRAEWARLAPILFRAGRVHDREVRLLEEYCRVTDRLAAARKLIKRHGMVIRGKAKNGTPILRRNPACVDETRLINQLRSLIYDLGLAPGTRERVFGLAGGSDAPAKDSGNGAETRKAKLFRLMRKQSA